MDNASRLASHRKPSELEEALAELSQLLGPVNASSIRSVEPSDAPTLFIVGCARSGTTLLYQTLAQTKQFAYPTNFLSRFFYSPVLGAKLQRMLFDFDFSNEMLPIGDGNDQPFTSHLGKTRGPLAPHEFWYFWRRFFRFGDDQSDILESPDTHAFMNEVRCIQSVFKLPMAMKALNMNWNLELLSQAYEGAFFLYVHRDVEENATSIVSARRQFFGDETQWYSFKPPGFERLSNRSPMDQARWQVHANNEAIEKSLRNIDPNRVIATDLKSFRSCPRDILTNVTKKLCLDSNAMAPCPDSFENR